uniref:Uncharacterized protein n=1 Tax=Vombatus ursinus TaxID=29139 RepID=A0A4X2L1Q1_VOMUR
MADLAKEEKADISPPVFVFQKDQGQKRSADGSTPEEGEDSVREDGSCCPLMKRERTSSLTQFPPSHSWKPICLRTYPPTPAGASIVPSGSRT